MKFTVKHVLSGLFWIIMIAVVATFGKELGGLINSMGGATTDLIGAVKNKGGE